MNRGGLEACLGALRELRDGGEETLGLAHEIIPDVYERLGSLVSKRTRSPRKAHEELLTEDGRWLPAEDLVFGDDLELRDMFPDLPYVYAPMDPETAKPLFRFLGVPILSERVRENTAMRNVRPLPLEDGDAIRAVCTTVAERFGPREERFGYGLTWAERARCLEVYVCDEIKVRYVLDTGPIRRQRTLHARCVYQDNELYVDRYVEPLGPKVADGLCRMFAPLRREAYVELAALLREARHSRAGAMAYEAMAGMHEEDQDRLTGESSLPSP